MSGCSNIGIGPGGYGSRAVIGSKAAGRVTGVDPLAAYISFARQAVANRRAQFELGAAESLAFPDNSFDATLALLVLQDFSDPEKAVREMARVTRPGGEVAACVWDFDSGLPMLSLLWEALAAVAPDAWSARRSNRSSPAGLQDLEALWRNCGLLDAATEILEIQMNFSSFDDYWQPFLAGSTPSSALAATLETQTLGPLARVLRGRISEVQHDGSFVMLARAWAIRGRSRE
jgi:SAM-dependent methyltransferase